MITKKKSEVKTTMEPEIPVASLVEEYLSIHARLKTLEERKKEIADRLKTIATSTGKKDDKGSYYLEGDSFICGSVAKKSVSLNKERAEIFFKSKNLWDDVKVVREEIDESRVEVLMSQGEISNEDIEKLVDVKTSYSVLVKAKEEMPTIEEKPLVKKKGK